MQTSPKGVHVGLAARRLRPSLTSGLTVTSEGKEGTGREPSQHLAEQPSRAESGTFCSFCCAPQRDLSLQTEGGSSLKEPSTFVPLLDAEARDLNLGDLQGGGDATGRENKRNSNFESERIRLEAGPRFYPSLAGRVWGAASPTFVIVIISHQSQRLSGGHSEGWLCPGCFYMQSGHLQTQKRRWLLAGALETGSWLRSTCPGVSASYKKGEDPGC